MSRVPRVALAGAVAVLVSLALAGDNNVWLAAIDAAKAKTEDDLARGFAHPPDAAKPWVYWWWLDDMATKDGITRDLEEMHRQGIAGALVFDAGEGGPLAPKGPPFMSQKWRELFTFAVSEADRLGMQLSINLCSGWNAGGTWVKPEQAAQKLACSQTLVRGPAGISQVLPQPPMVGKFYRDVALLAYPVPADIESATPKLTASSSYPNYPPALATDGDPKTRWISNSDKPGQGPTPARPEFLQWEYAEPFPAASLQVVPYTECGPRDGELQFSADGKTFQPICRFTVEQHRAKTVTFEPTPARFFRLVLTSSYPFQGKECWNVQISEIALLKRGQKPQDQPGKRFPRRELIDLTGKMDPTGRLAWQAPAGAWMVLRLGSTLVAGQTKCVSPGNAGLEIDPMSAEAMDAHFAATADKLVADVGALAGKTLAYTHIDSWEIAEQPTWSPGLPTEFKRRYGYDLLPYLPALVGWTVDDREMTDRFLWDYRRMVADCVADNYYGRQRELSRRHGLGMHSESGGPFVGWHDELQNEGRNDIPMGEFWYPSGGHADFSLKQAASAAHTYGKRLCQAEAYTDMGPNWEESPRLLKPCGDRAFCHGLTRTMLCFYVHQPYEDARPGYQWEAAGTHFDRHVTWWPKIHAWLAYLSRCQHLLQQGLFVADVCYFYGQDVPASVPYRNQMNPPMPPGYDYDVCNTEVLLDRLSVRDGRIVLPDGMSYRLLALPVRQTMSPEVLEKIAELVRAGATVVGPKPLRAPGLKNYPQCDEQVGRLAGELWGEVDGQKVKQRKLGQGRIIWGKTLAEILAADNVTPDVEVKTEGGGRKAEAGKGNVPAIDWIHRRDGQTDIYFVCNPLPRPGAAEVVFRISGKEPEIWDAVTGQRWAADFRHEAGRTVVPMRFAPCQSWFVVFRPGARDQGTGARDQGTGVGDQGPGAGKKNLAELKVVQEIAGPWTVAFDPKWGGPAAAVFEKLDDWSKRPEEGIKYYSGSATYRKTFDLQSKIHNPQSKFYLDLGDVREVAEVRLNGKNVGVVWTAPWRVEITEAVRPAQNVLEIDVVNLWPNRLIGDGKLPAEQRLTKTNVQKFYRAPKSGRHKLLESGLLGPVTIQSAEGILK